MNSVKALAESPDLNHIPSIYTYSVNSTEPPASDIQDEIPTIDFSLLTSADPDLRSKMIQELDMACKDWGFFRNEFEEKGVFDPIRYGTSFNPKKDEILYWRDFLKIFSNGKYKSVEHRAIVNNAVTRLSVAVTNGPSLDVVVEPAYKLVTEERCAPGYIPMKYKEYLKMQQSNKIVGKTCLDRVRI
ncbi:hypothetical protein L1987_49164 [Smallanthus sonchifolius]|uniref:Uncharacterized protein n=1 Tax=Smallanthus sonchifolius TaxID=185202 RepID=A0ACB9FUX7_9ASTR|nr:hypothetical protein L1987_49164 [Smallanthus sonchifolius]